MALPETMKAVVFDGLYKVSVQDRPVPQRTPSPPALPLEVPDADTGICFSPGTNTNKNNDDVQCVMTGM